MVSEGGRERKKRKKNEKRTRRMIQAKPTEKIQFMVTVVTIAKSIAYIIYIDKRDVLSSHLSSGWVVLAPSGSVRRGRTGRRHPPSPPCCPAAALSGSDLAGRLSRQT